PEESSPAPAGLGGSDPAAAVEDRSGLSTTAVPVAAFPLSGTGGADASLSAGPAGAAVSSAAPAVAPAPAATGTPVVAQPVFGLAKTSFFDAARFFPAFVLAAALAFAGVGAAARLRMKE
ncbi:MAG TPA: hypothetical protein VGR20_14365, partial [Acidimicrobiia bacterium]|nr:hypothetical protein [Acidimicrobiia bacterium]